MATVHFGLHDFGTLSPEANRSSHSYSLAYSSVDANLKLDMPQHRVVYNARRLLLPAHGAISCTWIIPFAWPYMHFDPHDWCIVERHSGEVCVYILKGCPSKLHECRPLRATLASTRPRRSFAFQPDAVGAQNGPSLSAQSGHIEILTHEFAQLICEFFNKLLPENATLLIYLKKKW